MIIREILSESLVRIYSDAGVYIHGGYPEADYEEAIDPIDVERVYVETDIPVIYNESEETINAEFAEAGQILMGVRR